MIMAGATSSQSPIVAGGAVIPSIWALNTGKRAEVSMSEMGHFATGRAFKNYAAQTSRTFDRRQAWRSVPCPLARHRLATGIGDIQNSGGN